MSRHSTFSSLGVAPATTGAACSSNCARDGVGVNVHYIPVHLQPYYRALGFAAGQFPQAEAYAREAITLPLYPALTDAQQDHVIERLRQALRGT